nr:hypothetical protein [uncultured Clostridium sp.]
MGQYNKAVLTAAGENLIARALAGEIKLSITKAKTSDYAYPGSTDLKSQTDMQGIRQTVHDPETTVLNETMIQTRVLFSNEEIASTYYIHNIGLYAVDGTEEVLFCIVIAETPDEMPQYNGVASTSYIYNIQNVVQDAVELNIIVNPSGTATIQDVLERVDASGGDISETVIKTLDNIGDKYPIPTTGENVKRFFGKVLTFLRNIRPLTGDITFYVSANTGSDITGDGSKDKPFKTIQQAINIVPKDLGSHECTIKVEDGIYDEELVIMGFHSGALRLYSTHVNTISDNCKVSYILCSQNASYVFITGFNITTITRTGIDSYNNKAIIVDYCKMVGNAPAFTGMYFAESDFQVYHSVVSNRANAVHAYKSNGNSGWWGTTSGNSIGIYAMIGSTIKIMGTQPQGTISRKIETGGTIFYENGTQIMLITSGLSCTWGVIYEGYIRHGNSNGAAMVTIQCRVAVSTPLLGGGTYYVNGFPPLAISGSAVAVTVHDTYNLAYCQLNDNGSIQFNIVNSVPAGNYFVFNCTYLTTS